MTEGLWHSPLAGQVPETGQPDPGGDQARRGAVARCPTRGGAAARSGLSPSSLIYKTGLAGKRSPWRPQPQNMSLLASRPSRCSPHQYHAVACLGPSNLIHGGPGEGASPQPGARLEGACVCWSESVAGQGQGYGAWGWGHSEGGDRGTPHWGTEEP